MEIPEIHVDDILTKFDRDVELVAVDGESSSSSLSSSGDDSTSSSSSGDDTRVLRSTGGPLVVHNNCGESINYLKVYWLSTTPSTQTHGTGQMRIGIDQYVTILDNVATLTNNGEMHFFGLHYFYNRETKSFNVTEVAHSGQPSTLLPEVGYFYINAQEFSFHTWMREVYTGVPMELCTED